MNHNELFNSKTAPIPPLRQDLQIIPVEQNGDSYLYFHDERGYIEPNLALDQEVRTILSLLDGQKSVNDLKPYLGNGINEQQLLQFVRFLDEHRLLASDHFREHAQKIEEEYEESTVHASVTAGYSYPDDPQELREILDNAFESHSNGIATSQSAKALYAPHIDPRVALDSYVKAFAPIKDLKPKRVVILATSHYAGLYPEVYQNSPFVLVNKDFELPLGTIPRDESAIQKLLDTEGETGITAQDRAHRLEHSIELHLLFLSYLWDHEFTVVPFLTRGLDDLYYKQDGHLGKQLDNFSSLLRDRYGNNDNTFFLISGDLAHFGKKFGDESAAQTMFEDVKSFDQKFLDRASKNQRAELLELMKEEYDPYRTCGFPPLYTFLNGMRNLKGKVLSYDLWDEQERDSAVTFGSILYQ